MTSSFVQSRLDLACEPSAVRYARGHAREVLDKWGLPEVVVDDALTIVSELATNAVRHAGGPAAPFSPEAGQPKVRSCYLSLLGLPDHLYLAFYDEARDRPPVMRHVTPDSESGRGITLVSGLCHGEWGWTPSTDGRGKIVWARMRLPDLASRGGGELRRPLGVSA